MKPTGSPRSGRRTVRAGRLLWCLREWIARAEAGGEAHAQVMALATAALGGAPSVRIVSARGIDEHGVRFFTGLRSRKARELLDNPRAAAVFFFPSIRRQLRLEGRVEPLDEATCDAYFRSRPAGHRISTAAWIQGERIAGMGALRDARARIADAVDRPAHWGGFRLIVDAGELWIGGDDRLHQRLRFEGDDVFRLAP